MSRRPTPPPVVQPVHAFNDSPFVQLLQKENEKLGKLKETSVGGTMLKMPAFDEETMDKICTVDFKAMDLEARAYGKQMAMAGPGTSPRYWYVSRVVELAEMKLADNSVKTPACQEVLKQLIKNGKKELGMA